MRELSDNLKENLVVIYQVEELALVESFWGNFLGREGNKYHFHIDRTRERLPVFSNEYRIRDDQEILISPEKITRVLASKGSTYKTIWKKNLGLAPAIQSFYDGLSAACDQHCKGWDNLQVEVFFEERKPLYGRISHEILDEGLLSALNWRKDIFVLDTFGSRTLMPISTIDRIIAYSWPRREMDVREEGLCPKYPIESELN